MGLSNVHDTRVVVDKYDDVLRGGLTAQQLTDKLTTLNLRDAVAVQTEVRRCNNRCNGNDVDVSVKAVQAGGISPDGVQLLTLSFSINEAI